MLVEDKRQKEMASDVSVRESEGTGKLDRRMSIAVVGCHYDEKKLAGQFMNKEKIRRSIKATASVCKLK